MWTASSPNCACIDKSRGRQGTSQSLSTPAWHTLATSNPQKINIQATSETLAALQMR